MRARGTAKQWGRPSPAAIVDGVLGAGLFVICVGEILTTGHWRGAPALAVLAAAVITLPLVVARRFPVPVVFTVLTATALFAAVTRTPQSIGVFFALLAASFNAGRRIERHRVVFLGAAAVVSVVAALRTQPDASPGDYTFTFGLMAGVFAFGALLRSRSLLARAEASRADRAEEQQTLLTQVALQDERARIARDLHDVVAHAVSVIVVQSVGGRSMLAVDPAKAAGAFDVIEATGQDALREMRRLLGVLRTVDENALLEPQPTIEQIPELVTRARAAGLDAELSVAGTPTPVADVVGLSAYRIVQEALTNALKHVGGGPVHVGLDYSPARLSVAVTNPDPAVGPRAVPLDSGGHGLLGMRERAALCGGSFRALRRDGTFVVEADLPLVAP